MLQSIYGILQKLTGSAERLKAKSGRALLSRPSSSCEAHPLLCGIRDCVYHSFDAIAACLSAASAPLQPAGGRELTAAASCAGARAYASGTSMTQM